MNAKIDRAENRRSYEGVEALHQYADRRALDRYREQRLRQSLPQVRFIRQCLSGKLRVYEPCSGNSRLLYALARKQMLAAGIGVEISVSRHRFAERWRHDLGIPAALVRNVRADVGTFIPRMREQDLVVCLDGSLNFFPERGPAGARMVLRRAAATLRRGGLLIAEFLMMARIVALCGDQQGPLRVWESYPCSDPFAYLLSEFEYCSHTRILRQAKTFIGRDGTVDRGKKYSLQLYTARGISDLIRSAGVRVEGLFYGWDCRTRPPARPWHCICVARKG